MKKRRLHYMAAFILLCCCHAATQAQIAKGTSLVGGSIYFNTNKSEDGNAADVRRVQAFGLTPSYGRAIKTNLIVGGDLNFSNTTEETTHVLYGGSDIKTNTYGLGVFARNYRNLGKSGFYLLLQSRLGANFTNGEYIYHHPDNTPDRNISGYDIRLNFYPGLSYAVTPKFHIETGLNNLLWAGYSSSKSTVAEDRTNVINKSSGFDAGVSLGSTIQWSIGFRFLWGS